MFSTKKKKKITVVINILEMNIFIYGNICVSLFFKYLSHLLQFYIFFLKKIIMSLNIIIGNHFWSMCNWKQILFNRKKNQFNRYDQRSFKNEIDSIWTKWTNLSSTCDVFIGKKIYRENRNLPHFSRSCVSVWVAHLFN